VTGLRARRKYEAKRRERENETRPFVAIDSEGGSIGSEYDIDGVAYQPHKSFLWGAGDINGAVEWLYGKTPLGTREIVKWLLKVADRNPRSIFISFAFGYDVAQLVADLPYDRAWELQHGKRFEDKDKPKIRADSNRVVHWRDYGFQYLKGKSFSIFEVDRFHDSEGKYRARNRRRLRIYDVFGFFQTSFLAAIRSMPNVASATEYAIIEKGKSERGEFYHSNKEEIKEYTRHELMILCRMMTQLRQAMAGQKIFPVSWYGAGSIAQALMKREKTRAHLGHTKAEHIEEWQEYAHRAYFGGRIELIQQGVSHDKLYGYDLASAYPAAAVELSSMGSGGRWISHGETEIRDFDRLSVVRLRAQFVEGRPFYPLPFRTSNGAIFFPQEVYGSYMVDEVLAAQRYIQAMGGRIAIEKVWQFVPGRDEKPFAFLKQMFDYRAQLPKTDITQIVIKLGINSVYGKLAQAVGQFGKAPTLASPWHAAAITAWTRARLLDAALHDPEAIVMLATDGIVSKRALPLEIPIRKTLGEWEAAELPQGGVYVQSGVYAYAEPDGEWKAKSRGFRPSNIDGPVAEFIRDTIPDYWARGIAAFEFPYRNYMTLGASTISEDRWRTIGQWTNGVRTLKLEGAGVKRDATANARQRRARSRMLVDTRPTSAWEMLVDENGRMPLSMESKNEWLDHDFGFRNRDENEQEAINAGFS